VRRAKLAAPPSAFEPSAASSASSLEHFAPNSLVSAFNGRRHRHFREPRQAIIGQPHDRTGDRNGGGRRAEFADHRSRNAAKAGRDFFVTEP